MTVQTIVFDVSGHGFGHLGQIGPIINKLAGPYVRPIVRTGHPASLVYEIIGCHVDVDKPPPEATLVMRSPTIVDVEASAEAYRRLHARWDEHVAYEAERLRAARPAALIADVPYLSLAAAKRIGVPTIALCSLNWLDIYRKYCAHAPDADAIASTIEEAYRSADLFLQPRPHMPMQNLPNRHPIGPVARLGRSYGDKIRAELGLSSSDRLVLVTFGGIQPDDDLQLPVLDGVHWLVGSAQIGRRRDVTKISHLRLSFIDLLASSDAVLTKIGYGTFVEAACNGVAIVSVPRRDWPETSALIGWAEENANFSLVADPLSQSDLSEALLAALKRPPKNPVFPAGIDEAIKKITETTGVELI